MLRFILIVLALLVAVVMALALMAAAVICLAFACLIGLPIWLFTRSWLRGHGLAGAAQHPMERVKRMYIDGKIDLFEFERRVARLIAVEN